MNAFYGSGCDGVHVHTHKHTYIKLGEQASCTKDINIKKKPNLKIFIHNFNKSTPKAYTEATNVPFVICQLPEKGEKAK